MLGAGACGVVLSLGAPKVLDALSAVSFVQPKTAVLNLNRIVKINEAALAARNLPADALKSEAERFALNLQRGIAELQKDCNCTLLVSSAVISPHSLKDYTDDLLIRLQLDPSSEQTHLNTIQKTLKGAS